MSLLKIPILINYIQDKQVYRMICYRGDYMNISKLTARDDKSCFLVDVIVADF